MLAIFLSCSAWRLSPRVALSPAACIARCYHPVLTEERTWWDKLMYGQQGKPVPPLPPPPPPDLRAVFDQWDTNGNGTLKLAELRRALLAVGIEPEAVTDALLVLGAEEGVTYSDLEARLPTEARASILARLNEDGLMESLYVPPEKVWRPASPIPSPSRYPTDCAARLTSRRSPCHAVGGRDERGGAPARPAGPVRCAPERKRDQPEWRPWK